MPDATKKAWKVGDGTPGPGRPKGVPNRMTKTVRQVFESVFVVLQKDKKAKLAAWAKQNPTEFYKLASKLIPAQMELSGKLTLEQLIAEAEKHAPGS